MEMTLPKFTHPLTAYVQGASRGVGFALVQHLAKSEEVGHVFASARSATVAPGLLELAAVGKVRLLDVDVTDEDSVAAAAARVRNDQSTIDLIINCAGVLHTPDGMQPERRLADIEPGNMVRSFRVNALGPLLIAKHFAPTLPRDRHCVFANLSARVGSIGDNRLGGWYAYRAAKAAQNQITRTLAIELQRRSPQTLCVALHPGTVATGLSSPFTRNRPAGRQFSPEQAAVQLLDVIGGLDAGSSGRFFAYDGSEIPW